MKFNTIQNILKVMKHEIKHDHKVKGFPFTLYCNNKMVASAITAITLNYCPICNEKFKKLPL